MKLTGLDRSRAHIILCAGVLACSAGAALSEVNTRLEYQVSPALTESWSSHINAKPGDSVDIRVRVSYIGTQSPIGLGAVMYQPTVSNWDVDGAHQDQLTPFATGAGDGSPAVPSGVVPDAPGQYGRIQGFGRTANGPNSLGGPNVVQDRGLAQVHNGVSYLRIAKSNFTAWQAGAAGPTGAGGVDSSQWTPGFRPDFAPSFDPRLTDIVVFKFSITLSADTDVRDLIASTPQELLSYWDTGFSQARARWVANTTEATGSIRGEYLVVPASIHVVPSPGVLAICGLGLMAVARRRK